MCTFQNALRAAQAARAMHHVVDEKPGGGNPIADRIGLHFGDVILKANDVFDDTVNVAARIADIDIALLGSEEDRDPSWLKLASTSETSD